MLPDPADLLFGSFRLSLRDRRLLQNGQEVPLTPKAFDTLQLLVVNAGHLVEKQNLMKAVWGEVFVDENTLNQNIFTIRKALGDASYIENVPRRGYRFSAVVTNPVAVPEPMPYSMPGPDRIELGAPGPGIAEPSAKGGFRWIAAVTATAAIMAWVYVGHAPGNPLDGAKFTRYTNFEGDELNGAISPDGKFVAFVSDRNGSFDNWLGEVTKNPVVRSKGGTRDSSRNLVRSLGFSGDGSLWEKELPLGSLHIAPITGGEARRFLEPDAMEPAWTADGKRLVYHTNDPGDSIYVADGTGANPKKIYGDGAAGVHRHLPAWSPDGAWIYFTQGSIATLQWDIWRIPSAGGAAVRLTQHNSFVAYPNPIDERTVLYVARDENGLGPWLWALDVETKKYRRISAGTDEYIALAASVGGRRLAVTIAKPSASLSVIPILERIAEDSDVKAFEVPAQRAWAPRFAGSAQTSESWGSKTLFFLSSLGSGDGLWLYRGKNVTELWRGADGPLFEAPAVSRNGKQIAILLRRNGRPVWHIGSVDRADLRSIGESLDVQGSATWSPDSKFLVVGGSDANGQGLFRIPVNGDSPIRLVSGTALNPVWSAEANLIAYAGASVNLNAPLLAVKPDGAAVKFPSIVVDAFGAQPGRFLPNGKGMIYRLGTDFWFLDLSTLNTRQLTRLKEPAIVKTFDITPDGRQIVFDRLRRNSDIYLIDLQAKL